MKKKVILSAITALIMVSMGTTTASAKTYRIAYEKANKSAYSRDYLEWNVYNGKITSSSAYQTAKSAGIYTVKNQGIKRISKSSSVHTWEGKSKITAKVGFTLGQWGEFKIPGGSLNCTNTYELKSNGKHTAISRS